MSRRLLAAAALFALLSCARNPVTGHQELSFVSEKQEIELGKESAQQVAQSVGLYEDAKLQQYVAGIGKRLARGSERPNLPWSFQIADDQSVNAFALPGGFLYVTRGILAHMNSEAELAGVLGHEIGHVTARHSVQQISRAELANIGLGIGSIFSETVARFGGLAGAGLQLLFLKYSRDDERQADELGQKYMVEQGYDPHAMESMFLMLSRVGEAAGAGKLPGWLSTHPDPKNRLEDVRKRLQQNPPPPNLVLDREPFLRRIDGLVYGADPREGYFMGERFVQPTLRFEVSFPAGWKTQNQAAAVVGVSPQQDAAVQVAVIGEKVAPAEALQRFYASQGVRQGNTDQTTINGLPAVVGSFGLGTQQGELQGLIAYVSHGGRTYEVVGYAPAQQAPGYESTFREAIGSFKPVSDARLLDVTPSRVRIVEVPRAMSVDEFASQFGGGGVPKDELALVNGLDANGRFEAGQLAKRIERGKSPAQTSPTP